MPDGCDREEVARSTRLGATIVAEFDPHLDAAPEGNDFLHAGLTARDSSEAAADHAGAL